VLVASSGARVGVVVVEVLVFELVFAVRISVFVRPLLPPTPALQPYGVFGRSKVEIGCRLWEVGPILVL